VILVDAHPRRDWLRVAVEKRRRGEALQRERGLGRGLEQEIIDCRLILVDSFIIKMAERTQIQLQAVTHMFFSQARAGSEIP
jgi:hypothetical protein